MHLINVRNVGQALPVGVELLRQVDVERDSRNGQVVVSPEPVTTVYERPDERVLFWTQRDANPFFHLMESLWMLAGRNDLPYLTKFVRRMSQFSDDHGKTQPGAYGYRWRRHFKRDQLDWAVRRLGENPDDRRVVIQMYDPVTDQPAADGGGRDIPCNLAVLPQVLSDGRLGMTVICRSNDAIWGAYGANAVHFSVLQEYLARSLGREIGPYWQVSNNFHAYKTSLAPVADMTLDMRYNEPYVLGEVSPYPLMTEERKTWDEDLALYMQHGPMVGLRDSFFRRVVTPIDMAHKAYRENKGERRYKLPLEILEQCKARDWRRACEEWIKRRQAAWERAQDAGPDHSGSEE